MPKAILLLTGLCVWSVILSSAFWVHLPKAGQKPQRQSGIGFKKVYKEDLGMKQTLDGSKAVAEQEKCPQPKWLCIPLHLLLRQGEVFADDQGLLLWLLLLCRHLHNRALWGSYLPKNRLTCFEFFLLTTCIQQLYVVCIELTKNRMHSGMTQSTARGRIEESNEFTTYLLFATNLTKRSKAGPTKIITINDFC